MTFLDELGRALSRSGVRGRARARILDEFADHLSCDPNAELGAPPELARQFADELGTARARRGAATAFAALALAGLLFGLAFLISGYVGYSSHARSPLLGTVANWLAVLAPQVAFATGTLAALRALHRRRDAVVGRPEATVIVRRTVIAVVSGIATMAALALEAIEFPHAASAGARTFSLIAAAVGGAALLAALPSVLGAIRLRPSASGDAGDIFDDLGPLVPAVLRASPWRPALVVAAGIGVAVALAGVVGSDPYDGLLRGVLDGGACLIGFAALGPFLGLWRTPVRAQKT
jgi:hypothetical protein